MSVHIPAGSKGVDYSYARPPGAVLAAHGYRFAVRYISVPPSNPEKNLTIAERDNLWASGIAILLVWELNQLRPETGRTGGLADGAKAAQIAQSLGYDPEVPLLCAIDTNTVSTNVAVFKAYALGFAEACAPFKMGVYGDADILIALGDASHLGWLPSATSWSSARRAEAMALGLIDVTQSTGFYLDGKYPLDPNTVIHDIVGWGASDERYDEMAVITNAEPHPFTDGNTYPPGVVKWVVGETKRHLTEEEWQKVYLSNPGVALTNACLANIPDYKAPSGGSSFPATKVTSTVVSTLS